MQELVRKIKSFGFTANEISDRSGLPLEKVINILQQQTDPSMSELRKIARALRVSPDLLISDNVEIPSLSVLYRKALNEKQKGVSERLSYIIGNALNILEAYPIPLLNSNISGDIPQTAEGARILAEQFRQQYFQGDVVSAIPDLAEIVSKELNCVIIVQELGPKAEGASAIINGVPFIILSPRFEPRMFFTLAHELGHILTHHQEQSFLAVDEQSFNPNTKRQGSEEAFAHAFASELLMPVGGVGSTLRVIRDVLSVQVDYIGDVELLVLSHLYGVSFEVAALRCENLGLLPIGSAASLYEALVKEHKNPEVRARQLELPPRIKINIPKVSSNLLIAAIKLIKRGEISLEKASELLGISVVDIVNYNSETEWI